MKKDDLVKAMKNGWPNRELMLNAIFLSINKALINRDSVTVHNFGRFDVIYFRGTEGHNFQTGERIRTKPKYKIKFTPSPKILELLNAGNNNESDGLAGKTGGSTS